MSKSSGNVVNPMDMVDTFARNATAGAVFAATTDGRVYCVRRKGAAMLTEKILRGEN